MERTCAIVLSALVAGLAASAAFAESSGPAAEVEKAWLTQERMRQSIASPQAGGVTTASDAAGGVDGVKNGAFGFHTSQQDQPWWQVDLGKVQPLDRVVVWNRCTPDAARAWRLRILLSDDGKAWREAYRHDGTAFHGVADSRPLSAPMKGAEARFVRIQLPVNTWLHLDEVEVFGQADPKANVALHRPADESSTSEWSTAKAAAPAPAAAAPGMAWPVQEVIDRGRRLVRERQGQGAAAGEQATALDAAARRLAALPADAPEEARRQLYLEARWAVRRLVLADPLLNFDKLLFVRRQTYTSSLRQVSPDGADEPEMIKAYGHGYDDLDPCYLPDGRIMFASTRAKRAVLCHNAFTTTCLHVMNADGTGLRPVSGNTANEFTPVAGADGRVIYTRWEYVDKGCGDVQSLWTVNPDGSRSAHLYKNNVSRPATLIDCRDIPGSHRFVAVGAPHMPLAVGPVILIDTHVTQLGPEAMTNLTPEIRYPGHAGYPTADKGFYKEPWPLSEKLFLAAYSPERDPSAAAGYGLYLLDGAGNRELIYKDAEMSCFEPVPLRPRRSPPQIPPAANPDGLKGGATLVMIDVYQGLTGIERGRVKYLRVMEDLPKPWDASWRSPGQGDSMGLQNPAVSLKGHFAIKKVWGVVPVEEDGSACFTVPAEKNLYFQALDADYMELQRMRTLVNMMPGEHRSCIGCHEPRTMAPTPRRVLALLRPPRTPAPQPGETGPRMVHYPLDVQPVLDKHCVTCHGGAEPKGKLDLSGEPTTLFSRSYENLINRKLINNIDVDPRDAYVPAEPPLTFGSHRSTLIERIRKGPCEAKLSQPLVVRHNCFCE
ncbi:MAG: discoidin domain-containing protein [Planctomycetota bacterium]|nr:discoidin domain-containing protein [Planctomycetota bacterium]